MHEHVHYREVHRIVSVWMCAVGMQMYIGRLNMYALMCAYTAMCVCVIGMFIYACNRHVHVRLYVCVCMFLPDAFAPQPYSPQISRPSVDTFLSPYFFFQPPSCSLSHLNEELGLRFLIRYEVHFFHFLSSVYPLPH